MEILLYKNQYPRGTKYSIQFLWDSEQFVIRTYEKEYHVQDSEIEKREGTWFFNPSKQNTKYNSNEIEIPLNVIERKDALNIDLQNRKGSITKVAHTSGIIYFSINADGKIISKLGHKTAVSDIEMIENKNAINIESLGLSVPYIEVPQKVETAYLKAKNARIMERVRLISAGKSLLTGKEYFKFNSEIPSSQWESVKSHFEYKGTGGSGLNGWLTNQPENVRNILGLKPTDERENDVELFEDAITLLETAK